MEFYDHPVATCKNVTSHLPHNWYGRSAISPGMAREHSCPGVKEIPEKACASRHHHLSHEWRSVATTGKRYYCPGITRKTPDKACSKDYAHPAHDWWTTPDARPTEKFRCPGSIVMSKLRPDAGLLRIVSDGTPKYTHVYLANGSEVTNVQEIDININAKDPFAQVDLTVGPAKIDINAKPGHVTVNCPVCSAFLIHECKAEGFTDDLKSSGD